MTHTITFEHTAERVMERDGRQFAIGQYDARITVEVTDAGTYDEDWKIVGVEVEGYPIGRGKPEWMPCPADLLPLIKASAEPRVSDAIAEQLSPGAVAEMDALSVADRRREMAREGV